MDDSDDPTEDREWLESIHQSLKSLDNDDYDQSQSCNICLVPEGLKKCNLDAYMPRVVSIGPRFIGREDLLPMEEVKLRCMSSLLHRGKKTLLECGEVVSKLVEEIRASYAPDFVEFGMLPSPDLAKIMLVDGCFLLELLISKGLDSYLLSSLHKRGPAAEMIDNDDVLSDLMLFENQIPMCVLYELSQTILPEDFGPNARDWVAISSWKKINELILNLLGYYPLQFSFPKSPHILDLVCNFVSRRTGERTSQELDHVVLDIDDASQTRPQQQLKLKRCALRLLTSGVTIKVKLPEDKDSTGFGALSCFSLVWNSLCGILFWLSNIFVVKGKHMDHIPQATCLDFNFKFQNRKLEIQQLHITKTTKARWCNLIAMEHHQKIQDIKNTGTSYPGGCNSTCAAFIFNALICSEDDVQFLKDKKIVVDHVNMSNQELMNFFRKIALGIDHKVVESGSYIRMVDDINHLSKGFFIKRIWSTVWNSFSYRQEWLFKFLNHNYNFVATVVSLCTVVQTIYTIIAYQLPK